MTNYGVTYSELDFNNRDCVTIRASVQISKSTAEVWKEITTPSYLERVHPFCEKHQAIDWDAVGKKDKASFYSGKTMTREIIDFIPNQYYTMKVIGNKVNLSTVTFAVKELDEDSCTFSIKIDSEAFRNTPRPFWKIYAKGKIQSNLMKYLHSVVSGVKYYCETGEAVRRNQFGSHPRFSP